MNRCFSCRWSVFNGTCCNGLSSHWASIWQDGCEQWERGRFICCKCGDVYSVDEIQLQGVTLERWEMDLCPDCVQDIEEYLRGE